MTIGDAVFEVLLRLQQQEISVSVSRPTVKLYMGEALQFVRRIAEQSDYLFYTKSQSFSGATIAYPADFKSMIDGGIVVPNATDGTARIASNRQYVSVNANQYEKGSAANPVARLGATGFTITPSCTGTFYYLFNFGETETSNESTEITTLVPWIYEELVILKTVEFLMLRHFLIAEPQVGELRQDIDNAKTTYMNLYKKWLPDSAYREEQPSPATLTITTAQNQ